MSPYFYPFFGGKVEHPHRALPLRFNKTFFAKGISSIYVIFRKVENIIFIYFTLSTRHVGGEIRSRRESEKMGKKNLVHTAANQNRRRRERVYIIKQIF
jgi:hypothetical protein